MSKRQKRWVYSPPKPKKPQVPESIKLEVSKAAENLIETFLKSKYVQPPPKDARFNYIVDIYTKYACPGPNAISPSFESKFARMEYVGDSRFHLSFMRYTGEWIELYQGLSLEACLKAVQEEPYFQL